MQTVIAEVPLAELANFTTFIRQTTQGRGWFTTEFARYEILPEMLVPAWSNRPGSWAIWMSLVKIKPANENSARLSPDEAISARHAKASPL